MGRHRITIIVIVQTAVQSSNLLKIAKGFKVRHGTTCPARSWLSLMSLSLQWCCFNDFQTATKPGCCIRKRSPMRLMKKRSKMKSTFSQESLRSSRQVTSKHFILQEFPEKLLPCGPREKNRYRYTAEVFDCNESWLLAHLRPDFLKPCIAHRRSHLDRDSTGHHLASPIITLIFPHSIWFDLIRYHYDIWVELVLKTFGWTGMVWDWMDQDQHIERAKDASERAPLMVRCTSALSWAACDGCLLLFVYSLMVLNLFFTMSRYFEIRLLLPLLHNAPSCFSYLLYSPTIFITHHSCRFPHLQDLLQELRECRQVRQITGNWEFW